MLLPERDSRGWTAKALREAGNSFLSEVRGLSEHDLSFSPPSGEPSIKELLAHLRDAADLAYRQVMCLIDTPERPLPVWDVELLLMERDYRTDDLGDIVASFRDTRQDLSYLIWGLSDYEWERKGRHPYRGEVDIATIAGELARHDLEHLVHVRSIKGHLSGRVRVSDAWDDMRIRRNDASL